MARFVLGATQKRHGRGSGRLRARPMQGTGRGSGRRKAHHERARVRSLRMQTRSKGSMMHGLGGSGAWLRQGMGAVLIGRGDVD